MAHRQIAKPYPVAYFVLYYINTLSEVLYIQEIPTRRTNNAFSQHQGYGYYNVTQEYEMNTSESEQRI